MPENPIRWDIARKLTCDQIVQSSIASAGWAPFHYDRGDSGIAEPWRVDLLTAESCRVVAANFSTWFDDLKPGNKLPAMLSACGALALISWLPQFSADANLNSLDEKQRQIDEEHLAATAAYVQNLLLLLTAAGLGTYWSSGGQFRSRLMYEKLGIQHQGRLLAAVFIDYATTDQDRMEVEMLPGKLRDRRCPDQSWSNTIELA